MSQPTETDGIFYIDFDGTQKGPMDERHFQALIGCGEIPPQTPCWKKGMDDWLPANEVFAQKPTPPAPTGGPSAQFNRVPPVSYATPLADSSSTATPLYQSEIIGFAMLAIPVIGALLIFLSGSADTNWIFAWSTVIITAVLAGIEAKKLGMGDKRNHKGRKGMKATGWVASLLVLWAISYPSYLRYRGHYGARNLVLPGLVVLLIYLGALFYRPVEVPQVNSPEVIALAKEVIETNLGELEAVEVLSPVEVAYERKRKRRVARAMLKTDDGGLHPFYYSVEWHDSKEGTIMVYVAEQQSELP